jgi:AcrR family transcriptional regulator
LLAETEITLGRVARKQQRKREALVQAGYKVMSERGIDSATMLEIAELADVGAGTVYSYFKSKDELAVAVLERVLHDLALRIEIITNTFTDPAQVYAYGVRMVLESATADKRWKQLLYRAEVIADAIFNVHGPFAIRDIENAVKAKRYKVSNARLTFKLACFAMIGASSAINQGILPISAIDETVVRLLCMNGVSEAEAIELAGRPCPPLPPEKIVSKLKRREKT